MDTLSFTATIADKPISFHRLCQSCKTWTSLQTFSSQSIGGLHTHIDTFAGEFAERDDKNTAVASLVKKQ